MGETNSITSFAVLYGSGWSFDGLFWRDLQLYFGQIQEGPIYLEVYVFQLIHALCLLKYFHSKVVCSELIHILNCLSVFWLPFSSEQPGHVIKINIQEPFRPSFNKSRKSNVIKHLNIHEPSLCHSRH